MEFENVLYEVRDGVLYLTLNRPEMRNALTPEMWRDISAAVHAAKLDDEVRVVIVSGAGDNNFFLQIVNLCVTLRDKAP